MSLPKNHRPIHTEKGQAPSPKADKANSVKWDISTILIILTAFAVTPSASRHQDKPLSCFQSIVDEACPLPEDVADYQTKNQTAKVSLPGYTRYKGPENKEDDNYDP